MGISPDDLDSQERTDEKTHERDIEPFPQGQFGESEHDGEKPRLVTEETPLLDEGKQTDKREGWWHRAPRNIVSSIVSSIRWVFVTLTSPGVYLIAYFYDQNGNFAPLAQLRKLFVGRQRHSAKMTGQDARAEAENATRSSFPNAYRGGHRYLAPRPVASSGSSSSGLSSESESEGVQSRKSQHARSKSTQVSQESNPGRRSIRIKLHNEGGAPERRHRKTQSALARTRASDLGGDELSAHLKSPTSPIAALTKYPRAPAPPRPLVPRRQPSYLNIEPLNPQQQKTLVLDLDETLIHSMSRGGRMSTGHMVEVRLNTASLGMSGASAVGQHPILYWVNKRPYCDEFLRRVCKWFNLVIFTASVQEYADPVIDWLEQERKFFSARYYRQHCTYRQGAYIKDLSAVEPDLSKVMILDNSPLSYLFHEGMSPVCGIPVMAGTNLSLDNAIPIQGWINDPTDSDLMHLVPLLEGLQYVHDVRALLALRGGEDGQH